MDYGFFHFNDFFIIKFEFNFLSEILRVIDSLQLTASNNDKIATPVDWKNGDRVMIHPNVKAEEAAQLFPQGYETFEVPSQKKYLRLTAQPSSN